MLCMTSKGLLQSCFSLFCEICVCGIYEKMSFNLYLLLLLIARVIVYCRREAVHVPVLYILNKIMFRSIQYKRKYIFEQGTFP